jgi:membrane protein HdeD
MQKMGSAIVLIILGLIVLAFPLLGVVPAAVLTGFLVLILGLGLLFGGIMEMGESAGLGILEIILGIIALVLGIGFIFNPSLFSFVAGLIVYIVGLFLIIVGIVGIITKAGNSRWNGVIALIIGLLYVAVGTLFASNPIYLGILIGLWLLIMGIMMLFQSD